MKKLKEGLRLDAWEADSSSPLLHLSSSAFISLFHHPPKYTAVHASYENNVFNIKTPKINSISIGPTIIFPHTVNEALFLKTVNNYYNFVKRILEMA